MNTIWFSLSSLLTYVLRRFGFDCLSFFIRYFSLFKTIVITFLTISLWSVDWNKLRSFMFLSFFPLFSLLLLKQNYKKKSLRGIKLFNIWFYFRGSFSSRTSDSFWDKLDNIEGNFSTTLQLLAVTKSTQFLALRIWPVVNPVISYSWKTYDFSWTH